jgi:hypothetical protein
VNSITRAFVDKMLDSSSFNKLLSGARECHKMLQKASENDEVRGRPAHCAVSRARLCLCLFVLSHAAGIAALLLQHSTAAQGL